MNPYGVITGYRAYLVALTLGASGTHPTTWRIDRMSNVTVLETPSAVPPDFDIATHAKRAFGVFQSDAEMVRWNGASTLK